MTEEEILSTDETSPLFLNTVCFTGHRTLGEDFSRERLSDMVGVAIRYGYTTFLCGMAMGFDSVAFDVVCEWKKKYPDVKVVACIPCENQEKYFPEKEKEAYRERLKKADLSVYVNKEYSSYCMNKRNRYMVDRSSVVFCYMKEKDSGTGNTVEYAKRKKREIVVVY